MRSSMPGTRAGWGLLVLGAVVGTVAISPYLPLDMTASRVEVTSALHFALLIGHIATAMIALVLGPLQFVPAIRANRLWHRRIGGLYLLAGVIPSGLLGIPVALLSGRLLTQIGLLIPAVGWLVTAGLAVRAIRRPDVEAHRSWMARNYALTFLAVTARILVPVMLLVTLPFSGETLRSAADSVPAAIPVGQVLGWVVNLVIAEIVIRRRRAKARTGAPSPTKESL